MSTTHYITAHGFQRLQGDLHRLKEYAKALARRLRESNDREYITDQLIDKELTEARIRELAYILDHARPNDSQRRARAELGSIVGVKTSASCWQFILVDPLEADPRANLIPVDSPLGKAAVGKQAGDVIKVETPHAGSRAYVVAYVK